MEGGMKTMRDLVLLLMGTFLLAGCGGGGDDSPAPAPAPAMAAGVWAGTATDQFGVYDVTAVVSPDGKFHMLSFTDGTQYAGTISGFKGNFQAYFVDGGTDTGTFTFDVNGQSMSGDYSMAVANGTADLVFVQYLAVPASLQTIQGTWRQEYSATNWLQVSIDGSGSISGQDGYGCVFSGKVSVPDQEVNVYRISLGVSECGDMDGTYSGVSFIDQPDMRVFVANPKYSIVAPGLVKIGD
jgi:hypothetical protein